MAEYALVAFAAALSLRPVPARREPAGAERDVGLGLLLAGVTALLVFWLAEERAAWIGAVLTGALAAMVVRLLVTTRDIRRMAGELADALAERSRLEVTDSLPGLRNRAWFERRLQAVLTRGSRVATVLINLDDFKTINDSLGHPAGDRCIVAYGERLQEAVAGAGGSRASAATSSACWSRTSPTRSRSRRWRAS
jgi:predicted signal transduction protein with EAL and GGDEF domain